MKQLLFCCLLLIAGVAMGQKYEYKGLRNFPVSDETGKVTYEGVVDAEGRNASELYSAAKEWVARNSDSRASVEMDLPGEKLVGKGSLIQSNFKQHRYTYDYILAFKDGRYRYELTNFILHFDYGTPATRGSYALEDYPKDKASGGRAQKLDGIYQGLHNDIVQVTKEFESLNEKAKKEDW